MKEFERLVELFEARTKSSAASRLDVLIDLECLDDPRVAPFMVRVLSDSLEIREVRTHALKWLRNGHFTPENRPHVADALCHIVSDPSFVDMRLNAVLALGQFTDVDGVQATLGGLALDGDELIDIRYCAFTSLERAGPTPQSIDCLRRLLADNMLGGCARDALSVWRTT